MTTPLDLHQVSFLPSSHLKGTIDSRPAEIIVMHSMECPPVAGRAVNWSKALATPSGSTSFAHFYTDPGNVIQVAELGRTVPHVGNGNKVRGRWTLGIEQAGYAAQTRQQWIDSGALNTAGPLLAALIAAGHGAPVWLEPADLARPGVRGVTSHNSMRIAFGGTTHTDPGPGYPHDLLLAYAATTAAPPPSPLEDPMFTLFTAHQAIWLLTPGSNKPVHVPTPDAVTAIRGLQADGAKVVELQGDKTWFYDILVAA